MEKKNTRGRFHVNNITTSASTGAFFPMRMEVELEAFIIPRTTDSRLAYFDCFESFEEAEAAIHSFILGQSISCDIKKVIFNPPATIVLWEDGTKTVVKTQDDDEFVYDREKGLAMAIAKKALGNKGNYYNVFTKAFEEDDKRKEEEWIDPRAKLEDMAAGFNNFCKEGFKFKKEDEKDD